MKTNTTLAALILFSVISAAFSSEIIKTERSEEFPDGKRIFTDYKRDGRLIMTSMSSPEAAKKQGWNRCKAYYFYFTKQIDGTTQETNMTAMQVFLFGKRIMKSAVYNNGSYWGSADFIDTDGDGRDDVLRLVEHVDHKNGLERSRLIDAFIVSPSGEIEPMTPEALSEEVARYNSEGNG